MFEKADRDAIFEEIALPDTKHHDSIETTVIVYGRSRREATMYFRLQDRKVQLVMIDDEGEWYRPLINREVLDWLRAKIELIDALCPPKAPAA